jgi:TPR repeat protein
MSCSNLAVMHRKGDVSGVDNQKAIAYMQRACDLGLMAACRTLALP